MEFLDICDENGIPTGQIISRDRAHIVGACHRTSHVWLVRIEEGRPQVLLQKRSSGKDSFPGCLDTSSAGHIPAGSEPRESAVRELYEELGIGIKEADLIFLGTFRNIYEQEFHGAMFRDNEFANVFVCPATIQLNQMKLQYDEVESVEWRDAEETFCALQRQDPAYCIPSGGFQLVLNYLENAMKPGKSDGGNNE